MFRKAYSSQLCAKITPKEASTLVKELHYEYRKKQEPLGQMYTLSRPVICCNTPHVLTHQTKTG